MHEILCYPMHAKLIGVSVMRCGATEGARHVNRGVGKTLGKFYQKPSRRFTSQTRMPTGIRGYRIKRGFGL